MVLEAWSETYELMVEMLDAIPAPVIWLALVYLLMDVATILVDLAAGLWHMLTCETCRMQESGIRYWCDVCERCTLFEHSWDHKRGDD